MRKRNFGWVASLLLSASIFMTSCDSDSPLPLPGEGDEQQVPSDGGDYQDAVSPEEIKDLLQNDGISFLSAMEGLSAERSLASFMMLNNLLSEGALEVPESIFDTDLIYINEFTGKYMWDERAGEWKYEEQADKLTFHFPTDNNRSNNSETFVVTGTPSRYYVELITESQDREADPVEMGEEYENIPPTNRKTAIGQRKVVIPESLTGTFISNGQEIGSILITAKPHANNEPPREASIRFTFGQYKVNFNANLTNSNANTASAGISKGNESLLAIQMNGVGNIEEQELKNASGSITIMNSLILKSTFTDYAAYSNAMDNLEANWDYYYNSYEGGYYSPRWNSYEYYNSVDGIVKKYAEEKARIQNAYMPTALTTADSYVIADVTFTPKATYSYNESGYYDYDTDRYVDRAYTYQYWEAIPQLKFEDGTKVDMDVYFGPIIEQLNNKLQEILANIEG